MGLSSDDTSTETEVTFYLPQYGHDRFSSIDHRCGNSSYDDHQCHMAVQGTT